MHTSYLKISSIMSTLPESSPNKNFSKNPSVMRSLFEMGTEVPATVEAKQDMEDPKGEAQRIVKRLAAIVEDHRQASKPLEIDLGPDDIRAVIGSLKKHAKGGAGAPVSDARDEIHGYCLNRLFEELVEEPSNILFTTQKGADIIRYDAMNVSFWLECLELFELIYCPPK